jgi:magnesium-protoporphyrin O-methyltransferase
MSACCPSVAGQFDRDYVEAELASRRKKPAHKRLGKTARRLVEALSDLGVRDQTLLDIGGGLGDIQAGLFPQGLRGAVHVEVSEPYSAAARDVAQESGFEDRVGFHVGDFASLAEQIPAADVVTLDRVICCYPDMPAILGASVSKARRVYAIVVPRNAWPVRLFVAVENLQRRLKKNPFRTFVYSTQEMDSRIRAHGFEPVDKRSTLTWWIRVYRVLDHPGEGASATGGLPPA